MILLLVMLPLIALIWYLARKKTQVGNVVKESQRTLRIAATEMSFTEENQQTEQKGKGAD